MLCPHIRHYYTSVIVGIAIGPIDEPRVLVEMCTGHETVLDVHPNLRVMGHHIHHPQQRGGAINNRALLEDETPGGNNTIADASVTTLPSFMARGMLLG